ncbi:MAG TPA: histidine kinase [Sphingomicrobium sp.]|nr:histidine kinase [Sphingomicrobium sp.]
MRKLLICIAAAGTALAVAAPAEAQFYPQPFGFSGYGYRGNGMEGQVQAVCSGQRGYALENRLRHEQREGEMDPYAAARIHQAIDRLEDQQRHECAEGDWRSIARIGSRYDRIGQWIETAAHGYQPWNR